MIRASLLSWVLAIAFQAGTVHAAEEPLTLGVFPRSNLAETEKQFTPLAVYLGERLGRKVVLVTSKNFDAFWEAVKAQRYDIVHYNQYHYIRSAHNYQVVAHSQEFGKDAVAGALYVRKDSGIDDVSQLRGRTIVFGGGRDAMLSYIAPRYLLMQAGLKEGDFSTKVAVNPPNALIALYHKQADAAGGGEILIEMPVVRNAIDARELKVLAMTEPLLFLPWAVKRSTPARLRQSIQSLLVKLGEDEAGRRALKAANMTGMRNAEDRDYEPHRRMAALVFGPEGSTARTDAGKP